MIRANKGIISKEHLIKSAVFILSFTTARLYVLTVRTQRFFLRCFYFLPYCEIKPQSRLKNALKHDIISTNKELHKQGITMEKIASFTVNHNKLLCGLYLSRTDENGKNTVSTFDLRFTAPNREPVMDMPAIHTIEHLGATFLRNCDRKSEIVYFGPMGCRTGFYLIMFGKLLPADAFKLVTEMCRFILDFNGEIPGAKPEECGNYSEQNLSMAKYYVRRFLTELTEHKRFTYPE